MRVRQVTHADMLSVIKRLVVFLVLLIVCGCVVEQGKVYVKDGQRYGITKSRLWRNRWWNYYERGLSYTAGGFWEDALADYQAAIKQRRDDQRRARTYGLHFVDYFPHCELGIVYYNTERFDDAERELTTSLAQVDRARCKFYLNKVRVALLQRDGNDQTPPRLVVDSPTDGLVTNNLSVVVSGHAEDDTYVAAVAVNDRSQFIELAAPRIDFAREVTLQDGPNVIDIVTGDLLEQQTRQRLTIFLDRRGPLLSVEEVAVSGSGGSRQARLQGYLSDQSRIARFAVAGQAVPLPEGGDGSFRYEVPIPAGGDALPFEAEDAVGNITRGSIALNPAATPPTRRGSLMPPGWSRWASLATGMVLSDARPATLPRLVQSRPVTALVISLADLQEEETVYSETIYLEGTVTSPHPITQFSIAGESLWRHPSRQLFFGYIAVLNKGENRFLLQAVDAQGNRAERQIIIRREIRPSRQLDARLHVAMLPLNTQGTPTEGLAGAVNNALLNAFVVQARFSLLEREHLEAVLREITLSQSDLADRVTAARIGKLAKAEGMLVGTVTETPSLPTAPATLTVYLRFVDVESSAVLVDEDVYGEGLDLATLNTLMNGLALKIRRHFPLIEGTILSKEGKGIVVNLPNSASIKPPMKLLVFRPGQIIQRGSRTFNGPDVVLGEARITEVAGAQVEAAVLQPTMLDTMLESDLVIMK